MAMHGQLSPRKLPRQRRSRETVAAIVTAAAQVFTARGYAGTTTNHIAERAGVSIGSVYQYFPNKDVLLVALAEQHLEDALATLEQLARQADAEDVEGLVRQLVVGMHDLHAAAPALHHVLLYEAPRTPELSARLHAVEAEMTGLVEPLLRERANLGERHARHAAWLLVHVLEQLLHEIVVHPPPDMDAPTLVNELTTMVCSYINQPCG